MRLSRPLLGLTAIGLSLGTLAVPASTASAADPYTVTTLHFRTVVGPNNDKVCDVVGDLYLPAGASASSPVPAILTTNGFGGSKDDQAGIGKAFSQRGYAVLSYSGLGFGGSDCKITLDDPDWDGKAGSQLVSYLGGKAGIAFTDDAHTHPAPVLDAIVRDSHDHAGHASTNDPRVGMVGGSYGGGAQFATAGVDPRVDTIVPIITWNDLAYSLGPNGTDQATATGVTTKTPGSIKLAWGLLFSAFGVVDGLSNGQTDPSRLLPCPNFATFVCPALVTAGSLGFFNAASTASLRHASVTTYMAKIKIPTLLMQGQADTLFNLNEAAATYRALKAQGTPVKMVWQSWGHSSSTPAPGELDLGNPDPASQYETGRISDWFEHYLKDSPVGTGPNFAYFRDWVDYTGNAAPAYATSSTFPVGTAKRYYLSGNTGLQTSPLGIDRKGQLFLTTGGGLPTTLNELDALGGYVKLPLPEVDVPGTFAKFTTPALTSKVDVVGSPTLKLTVKAPTAVLSQRTGPLGQLVLFVRVQDVGPDGKASDIRATNMPVRVPDVRKSFTVTLPGIVHRFAPGHKIRLVVSGGSINYRGGLTPQTVGIQTGTTSQVLTLPVVN
ncbi:S15 peptidase family protein [Aeromicrobium terrae]|uniref:ABC transporter ATP-binding protein n=1 Tax=Aeromicrobium terrae TaxID=2498846 RepID=A0A5C8NGB5_9ACTN|nr:CocE/NonD family hydrolase [Aeromicrobium terrae]TXL57660.1 ABC transporter ATP-binding protein [Aeromicrobium terrae]